MQNNELSFNLEDFDIKLGTDFIGRNFVYLEECDSSNTFLSENKDIHINGTVVYCEEQKKGKGRADREWISQKDFNLTFSVFLNENLTFQNINILNFVSSLAVSGAIETLYQLNTELKWPNDVLVKKKKISGILLNSSVNQTEINYVIIGIGINVNQTQFKGSFIYPPTSIRLEFGSKVVRERVLSETLNLLEYYISVFYDNPLKIIDLWKNKCNMLGEKVRIYNGTEEKFGIFQDIDNNGALILKTGAKIEVINFGDVSLRQ